MGSRGDFSRANPKCHVSQTVFPFTIHLLPFVRLHLQFFRLLLILLGYLAGASAQERASPQRYLIVCSRQNVDCSKSPIFSYDCWDRLLTVAGGHLGLRCTVGRASGSFASSQTFPRPLSKFDTYSKARLGTFETNMASCKDRCSFPTILRKNRGL